MRTTTAVRTPQRTDPRRLDHLPGLDGLRGVAVIAVVVYHFEPRWLPGGFIGVDVFFVLSGFLISSLLLREYSDTDRVDLRRFFVRRIRRLMPAVLVLIGAMAVYAATWADTIELARLRRHGLASMAYVSNWVFIIDGTTYTDVIAGASPLRHMWSLAIEEQMYLLLAGGVVALRMGRRGHRSPRYATLDRRRFGVGAAALAIASAAWMAWLSWDGASPDRTYFGTDTRAHAMLVGAVLGAVLVGRAAANTPALRTCARAGVVVLGAVAVTAAEDATWLHRGGFLVVAVAAAAVVVGSSSDPLLRRLLSTRVLVTVGAISYGLYLFHWPVLVILDSDRTGLDGAPLTALRVAVSVAIATASYLVVERPIRSGRLGARFGRRATWMGLLAIAATIVVLVRATAAPAPPTTQPSASIPADRPVAEERPADGSTGTSDEAGNTSDGAGRTSDEAAPVEPLQITVLGDSVAHTIIGGWVSATDMQSAPWTPDQSTFDPSEAVITSVTRPGCSFLPSELAIRQPNGSYAHASMARFCGDWRTDLAQAVDGADVLAVHLSNDLEDRWIDGQLVPFGSERHVEELTTLLDELHESARAAGASLVVVASAPRDDPNWSDARGEREAAAVALFDDWAATHDDATVIDLGVVICPDGRCPEDDERRDTIRWDGRHYTRPGAALVAEWLTEEFRNAVPGR